MYSFLKRRAVDFSVLGTLQGVTPLGLKHKADGKRGKENAPSFHLSLILRLLWTTLTNFSSLCGVFWSNLAGLNLRSSPGQVNMHLKLCFVIIGFCVRTVLTRNLHLLCFLQENKEDRIKEVDPKLLFPIKAWLLGFLPGHKFHWDEENDLAVQDEMEMESEPGRTKEDTRL